MAGGADKKRAIYAAQQKKRYALAAAIIYLFYVLYRVLYHSDSFHTRQWILFILASVTNLCSLKWIFSCLDSGAPFEFSRSKLKITMYSPDRLQLCSRCFSHYDI